MSSDDSTREARSFLDRVLVPVVVAGIAGAATVGAACLPSLLGPKAPCTQFSERLDTLSDLPDGKTKLSRLTRLLAIREHKSCPGYSEALNERNALESTVSAAEASAAPRPDVSIGRSKAEGVQDLGAQAKEELTLPAGGNSPASKDAIGPETPLPTVASRVEFSPSPDPPPFVGSKPAKVLRDIVVTPYSDPDVPFEGAIEDKLTMKKDARYELRPPQRNTITYRVVKGKVVVEVGGTPYFYCEAGDTFRLFWKNKPDFFTTAKVNRSSLQITDIEDGKHLGTSTCRDAPPS